MSGSQHPAHTWFVRRPNFFFSSPLPNASKFISASGWAIAAQGFIYRAAERTGSFLPSLLIACQLQLSLEGQLLGLVLIAAVARARAGNHNQLTCFRQEAGNMLTNQGSSLPNETRRYYHPRFIEGSL